MVTTKKTISLRIAALIAFAAMAGAEMHVVILPSVGHLFSGIYSVYPILLQPALPTFTILGLIYLLLLLYAVWQLASRKAPDALTSRINSRFVVLAAARIVWAIAWRHKAIMLTMLFMLVTLFCLITIIRCITAEELTFRESFFIKLPFFVLFGWINVTTVAHAAAFLVSLGVDSFGPVSEEITIATLAAGTMLGMWTGINYRSVSYLLVLIWTYAGVLFRHMSDNGMNRQYPRLVNATAACMVFLAAALVIEIASRYRDRKHRDQSNAP